MLDRSLTFKALYFILLNIEYGRKYLNKKYCYCHSHTFCINTLDGLKDSNRKQVKAMTCVKKLFDMHLSCMTIYVHTIVSAVLQRKVIIGIGVTFILY